LAGSIVVENLQIILTNTSALISALTHPHALVAPPLTAGPSAWRHGFPVKYGGLTSYPSG